MSSKNKKSKLIQETVKFENALRSAGFQDNYRYYFRVKGSDSDGTTRPSDPQGFFDYAANQSLDPSTDLAKNKSGNLEITKFNTGAINIPDVAQWADDGNNSIIALDIPPSSVTITSPFAISVVATNKGILEEHNGLVFKTIIISGNTGVLPRERKGTIEEGFLNSKFLSNYLPETQSSINKFAGGIQRLGKIVNGNPKQDLKFESRAEVYKRSNATGYGKFWRLHNFLVAYANAKKSNQYKSARLVFGCPKDNIEYVCTPLQFEMKRDASRPLVYNYTIVLKAWEVAKPFLPLPGDLEIPSPRNPAAIKDLANTAMAARDVIQNGRNVLLGVNNDIQSVLNVASQAIFFCKDLAGLVTDIRDFPDIIDNNVEQMVSSAWYQMTVAMDKAWQGGDERTKRLFGGQKADYTFPENRPDAPVSNKLNVVVRDPFVNVTGSDSGSGGGSGTGATPDPSAKRNSPARNNAGDFLKQASKGTGPGGDISLDAISQDPEIKKQLEDAKEDARNITSGDIRDLQADLQNTSDNLAQSIGLMDEAYATTYGLPPPDLGRAPTEDDIILMAALQDQKDGFGSLLSTGELLKGSAPDPFLSANANLPDGDSLTAPPSAFLTRINNGETIQDIAGRTLGDASRWREIAILNDLKPPYVTSQPLSKLFTAPLGRTVLVSDASDLAIGQFVTLSGISSTKRKILNIENLDSSYRVTFDGPDNLSTFVPSPVKKLLYAQAGTVVSGDPILIPSTGEADELLTLRPTPLNSRLSNAEKTFKIDLAVEDSGDFILSGDGDIKRSYGYDNAIQAIKLALSVERGELERHPSYGVGIPIGARNSDLSVNDLDNLVRAQITSDPRFTDVDTRVKTSGSDVRIEVVARGAEGTGLIPVEFRAGDPE